MNILHLLEWKNVYTDSNLTGADTWQFITPWYLLGVSKPYDFKLIFCYILLINSLCRTDHMFILEVTEGAKHKMMTS